MSEKFRIEKKSNFTVVSNDILMNNFMSMKATCLLMKMLGKPDNWDYTINGMKTFCVEGRDAIRSALKELEKFGYLERRKVRDSRGGTRILNTSSTRSQFRALRVRLIQSRKTRRWMTRLRKTRQK